MDHEYDDELRERRRSGLSPAGREILEELGRAAEALEPSPEGTLARADALPPSEREGIAAAFGAMARRFAERQRENMRDAALSASFGEIIIEARERERATGRPVDPNMTLGDALEILAR